MSGPPLSPKLLAKVHQLFPGQGVELAILALVTDCGDALPPSDSQDIRGIERIRCAVLKLSKGSLDRLLTEIEAAKKDWRDVLVAAGFALDANAHLAWLEGS